MILEIATLVLCAFVQERDLEEVKPLSFSFRRTRVSDAVRKLSKASGYKIKLGELSGKQRVTVRIRKASFAQALDALCRAGKFGYRWKGQDVELVKAERPKAASVSAGPFLLSAAVGPDKEWGKGFFLKIEADWERRLQPCWYVIKLESVTDRNGKEVPLKKFGDRGQLGDANLTSKLTLIAGNDLRYPWRVDFFCLSREVPKLKSVKGTVTFYFPAARHKLRFDDPADKAKAEVGGLPATLLYYGYLEKIKSWRTRVTLDVSKVPRDKRSAIFAALVLTPVRFVDKNNRAIVSPPRSSFGSTGDFRGPPPQIHIGARVDWPAKDDLPKAVEADIVTDVWKKVYTFELKNVPRK